MLCKWQQKHNPEQQKKEKQEYDLSHQESGCFSFSVQAEQAD